MDMIPPSDVRHEIDEASALAARDARAEAQRIVGDEFVARVLEPSPPAVTEGDWYADDPVAVDAGAAARVVSPVTGTATTTWDAWVREHLEHASWAAARWLGAYRRLPRPPATLAETRLALHRLAVYVVSPARRRANGKIGLRFTLGGIGTPFFGEDEQVRLVGLQIVRQHRDTAVAEPVTTLARAATFGLDGPPDVEWAEEFDVPPPGGFHDDLPIDGEGAAFLGDWYGFAYSVLEELRAEPESTETSRVQLWPEHFDAAFDCCPGDNRATFGASPGDAGIGEPYLYVLPAEFEAAPSSDVWNADTFDGAVLHLNDLVDAPDQRAAALAFYRRCRDLLHREDS
jgi:hypothetical protein